MARVVMDLSDFLDTDSTHTFGVEGVARTENLVITDVEHRGRWNLTESHISNGVGFVFFLRA
jgi:hypothetical protein